MFYYGRITDEFGNKLIELGPYTHASDLAEDLMFEVPEEEWEPDYEMSIWLEMKMK